MLLNWGALYENVILIVTTTVRCDTHPWRWNKNASDDALDSMTRDILCVLDCTAESWPTILSVALSVSAECCWGLPQRALTRRRHIVSISAFSTPRKLRFPFRCLFFLRRWGSFGGLPRLTEISWHRLISTSFWPNCSPSAWISCKYTTLLNARIDWDVNLHRERFS